MAPHNGEGSSIKSLAMATPEDCDSDATVEEDWELLGAAALRPEGTVGLVRSRHGALNYSEPGDSSYTPISDNWEIIEALPMVC